MASHDAGPSVAAPKDAPAAMEMLTQPAALPSARQMPSTGQDPEGVNGGRMCGASAPPRRPDIEA
jgi:hypothetical protein